MDEFEFISNIQQYTYRQPAIRKGIGDDAAVFRQVSQDIVIAKDIFVENIHFARHTMEPFHIGYKGLAANISDLAAMGATPAFYLVGISIPQTWSSSEIEEIYKGMSVIAKDFRMDLIGGDTVTSSELTLSITAIGFVNPMKSRYRSQARDGDIVFVTGCLGDSQAGFHLLTNPTNYNNKDYFIQRHQMPTPRVNFATSLEDISRVCLNDISDGLASEANEIAEASHVDIILDEEKIPTHPFYRQFSEPLQKKWKFFGGEDFELLGTTSIKEWPKVEKAAKLSDTNITVIGEVTHTIDHGKVYLQRQDKTRELLKKEGYNHLSR